jgi:pimeloyl-ACP methyl ester carboxylesterase
MITHHKTLGVPLPSSPKTSPPPTIVFFSGFPDSYNSFDKVYPSFLKTHHVILVIMPYYDKANMWFPHFLGPSFDSITESLHTILQPSRSSNSRIVLCGHDWGAFCVSRYVATHPTTVHKMILLDVSAYPDPTHLPLIISYQLASVLSFLLSRLPLLGFILGLIPIVLYPWKTIGPCPHEYNMPRDTFDTKPFMCYPYFNLFIGTFLYNDFEHISPKLVDDVPVLFMYGARKRVLFHSKEFLRIIKERNDGSDYYELNCGHWIQTQRPEVCVALIKGFIEI